ncbi:MAG: AAA domain-containing protein, partial [Gemmataceae bacterium]
EPLFDSPEIEIGLVAGPDQEMQVAEVVFPASTSIEDAKAFALRELQDLVVHANGLMPYWRETDDAWLVELSPRADRELDVTLLEGVTERVGHCPHRAARGQVGWLTTSFRFDRRAGWERDAAEHWLAERLGLRDTGRTAVLARGYRARPALGQFLSQLIHAGAVEPASTCADEPASFRFIAVPTAGRPDHRRPVEPDARWTQSGVATLAPRMRTARGGAGLELDLAESRRTEILPADLHPLLPPNGVVNYQEACALVQTLEAMVADPAFRSDCLAWQTRHGAEPRSRFRGLAVAILSAFPTQVQLLRMLVQRSSALAASGIRVEVGTPREMAQREVFAALISLTRSHANRAVPFSEHPRDLVLALTRASGHLVVLGDPGTLNRRSQWFGVLDHLDDIAGPLEQALIGQLLLSLQGSEPPARAPRALESSIV